MKLTLQGKHTLLVKAKFSRKTNTARKIKFGSFLRN